MISSCSNKESKDNQVDKTKDSISVVEIDKTKDSLIKAPAFTYKDINGKDVSLSDFKGKLVYMDIWATWCGPCIMQMPALKELEEKYKNEDIVFLSISIDPEKDKGEWEKMVKEENLKGVQLYAGQESNFPIDYKIEYIPRFILISPNGDILMDNAPSPMDEMTESINPKIVQVFDMYLKSNKKATS